MIQILNADDVNRTFVLDLGIGEAQSSESSANTSTDSGNDIRVNFAKGETMASVTKEISANSSVDFVFYVKKGQTLGYTVGYDFKDSDIEAFLTEPASQDISKTSGPKDRQEFVVKKTGDHRLTVNNTTKKKVTIPFYLDVE